MLLENVNCIGDNTAHSAPLWKTYCPHADKRIMCSIKCRPLNIHGCWRAVFFVAYEKLLRLVPRRLPCLPEGYFFGTMAARRSAYTRAKLLEGPDSRQMRRMKDAARMQNHSTGDQGVPGVPGEVSGRSQVGPLSLLSEGRYLFAQAHRRAG